MLRFPLTIDGPATRRFVSRGVQDFAQACHYVRSLPYGRNSSRANPLLVLDEGRGTCSSKHALLALLAREQNQPVDLMLGVIQMTGKHSPAVAAILKRNGLEYMPEMHCYLSAGGERFDFTGPENPITPALRFLYEEKIDPEQIETYKTELHKRYLSTWLTENQLAARFDIESFWHIREECVVASTAAGRHG